MHTRKGLSADGWEIIADLRKAIIRTGWSRTAELTGVDRVTLHRTFRAEPSRCQKPNFTTVCLVAAALSFRLFAAQLESPDA